MIFLQVSSWLPVNSVFMYAKNGKTQQVKGVNQGHPSSIFSFTISWWFLVPIPQMEGSITS